MMGLIEEWDIFQLFASKSGVFYFLSEHSPMYEQRIRPLIVLPYAIGYLFGPYAFTALHVLQAISLFLKGIAVAAIVNWLLSNRMIAVLCGLIFIVYPADTMQMTLRAVHINCALALSVCGIAMLMHATTQNNRALGLLESFLAGACFLIGGLIYEAGLFLAPLPLFLWWARYGWAEGATQLRRHFGPVAIWSFAVTIAATYVVVASLSGSNYESEVVGDHWTMARNVLTRVPLLFGIALYRLFFHAWYDGFRMLLENLRFWPWMLAAIIAAVSLLWIFPNRRPESQADWSSTARIVIAGFAAAVLGYLPYLTSLSHIMTSQRTYLYAAIGAVIVISAVLHALAKFGPALAVLLASLCLLLGLGSQWEQLVHYTKLSHRQRMMIAGILEAAPDAGQPNAKRLVIVDRSGATGNVWMLGGWELGKAMSWFYGTDLLPPVVCVQSPGPELRSYQFISRGRPAKCVESESGWDVFREPGAQTLHFARADIFPLTIEPDGHITAPTARAIQPGASVTAKWRKMLGCWPAADCMVPIPDPAASSVRFDFGKYWGLDDAPWGSGWREEEWNLPSRNPVSWSWMTMPEANLWFKINPEKGRYILKVRLHFWISQAAKDSLSVKLNGKMLQARWIDEKTLETNFDSSILISGPNELRLQAEQDAEMGVSVAVDQVTIRPEREIAAQLGLYAGIDVNALVSKRQSDRLQWCRDNFERTVRLMGPELRKFADKMRC